MKDYSKANKKWWNDVAPIHLRSNLYNLKGFKKGKTSLQKIEIEELGNIKGKTLLHLMCHIGMDTISLGRRGAIATGVDLSDESIRIAQQLAKTTKVPAKFVCSDIYKLPEKIDEKFDIVFTSYGVLCWVSNIKKWAKIIEHYLKPGGTFYIVELHPFTNILSYDFKLFYNYFKRGPYIDDSEGTYTNWDEKVKGFTYEWSYTVADVINSLIEQGLKVEFFHEFPFTMYEQFEGLMEKDKEGQYVLKNKRIKIPLLFSLKATKM
jgi:SAM-dependent methyltransferase